MPVPRWFHKPKVPGTQKLLSIFERQPFHVLYPSSIQLDKTTEDYLSGLRV